MPPQFDISVFERRTPWAACAALEEFLSSGGQCSSSGEISWVGAAFTSGRMASTDLPVGSDMSSALGWAHLATAIYESMGETGRAMCVRANMIIRFGHHPGDRICDINKVVNFWMSIPAVKHLLQMESPPHAVLDIDPDARVAAQELEELRAAGRLQSAGEVDRLLDIVGNAQKQPWQAAETVKMIIENRAPPRTGEPGSGTSNVG